jgi:hypothetical protein
MRNLQTNESPIIDLKIKLKVHGKDELMLNGSSKIIRPFSWEMAFRLLQREVPHRNLKLIN